MRTKNEREELDRIVASGVAVRCGFRTVEEMKAAILRHAKKTPTVLIPDLVQLANREISQG